MGCGESMSAVPLEGAVALMIETLPEVARITRKVAEDTTAAVHKAAGEQDDAEVRAAEKEFFDEMLSEKRIVGSHIYFITQAVNEMKFSGTEEDFNKAADFVKKAATENQVVPKAKSVLESVCPNGDMQPILDDDVQAMITATGDKKKSVATVKNFLLAKPNIQGKITKEALKKSWLAGVDSQSADEKAQLEALGLDMKKLMTKVIDADSREGYDYAQCTEVATQLAAVVQEEMMEKMKAMFS